MSITRFSMPGSLGDLHPFIALGLTPRELGVHGVPAFARGGENNPWRCGLNVSSQSLDAHSQLFLQRSSAAAWKTVK
jgi:hypothetical protein